MSGVPCGHTMGLLQIWILEPGNTAREMPLRCAWIERQTLSLPRLGRKRVKTPDLPPPPMVRNLILQLVARFYFVCE